MPLWISWWNAMGLLRPAFSRLRTFVWFATAVAGLTVRIELLGVTSIVRALKLQARFYNKLLEHFHSRAVKPPLRAVDAGGAAAIPGPTAGAGPACAGGRRHQGGQTGQEDAGGEAALSAVGHQHQTRVHHGAFASSREPARRGRLERFCRSPRRAHSRGAGVVQSGSAYFARQDARATRHRRHPRTLLLRRRRLLRGGKDHQRLAPAEQPPGHPGEGQCGRLYGLSAARPEEKRPTRSEERREVQCGRLYGLSAARPEEKRPT